MKTLQKGFTLIELMIVIAIIGILAAVAIPQYTNYIARSEVQQSLFEIRGTMTAVEDYVNRYGTVGTQAKTEEYAGVKIYGTTAALAPTGKHTVTHTLAAASGTAAATSTIVVTFNASSVDTSTTGTTLSGQTVNNSIPSSPIAGAKYTIVGEVQTANSATGILDGEAISWAIDTDATATTLKKPFYPRLN